MNSCQVPPLELGTVLKRVPGLGRGESQCSVSWGRRTHSLRQQWNRSRGVPRYGALYTVKATGSDPEPPPPVETLFMRELRRRAAERREERSAEEELRAASSSGAAAAGTEPLSDEQLKRARALSSEGLEGLVPRATELVRLGTAFSVSFLPLFLTTLAVFAAAYVYFGPNFIHGGSQYTTPRTYVDPYELLLEDAKFPGRGFYYN